MTKIIDLKNQTVNPKDLYLKELYITTEDNPYNPKEDFDNWLAYDLNKGYNTCERLDHLAHTSSSLTDYENNEILYEAIRLLCNSVAIGKDETVTKYLLVVAD